MTTWWRAPLIAAAISTLLCGLTDACYRRQVDDAGDRFEELQREWQRDPQLAAQIERERDIAGMLEVRSRATKFVHDNQPPTFATLSALLPPPALRPVTIDAALKRFRVTGPLLLQSAAEQWVGRVKGARVMRRATNAQQFLIEGVLQ
jgi:hypothetical protein